MSVAILRLVAGIAVTIFGLYLMSRFKSEAYGGYSPRNRWPMILLGLAVAICGIAIVG
ncbi:hypothetical protein [Streptomyces sp. CA-106131]|uniref:hypothetical protein n=1 Tax=Streptomyces sp. CA-106131 TaxID=3240045 RepID=UPI003D8F56C7